MAQPQETPYLADGNRLLVFRIFMVSLALTVAILRQTLQTHCVVFLLQGVGDGVGEGGLYSEHF